MFNCGVWPSSLAADLHRLMHRAAQTELSETKGDGGRTIFGRKSGSDWLIQASLYRLKGSSS